MPVKFPALTHDDHPARLRGGQDTRLPSQPQSSPGHGSSLGAAPSTDIKRQWPPSTGVGWVDTLLRNMRPDAMAGLGPAAGIVSPGVRRALGFVAEQGAERIPNFNRAKLTELLGRAGNIRPLARPAEQLPSHTARNYSIASDVNRPHVALDLAEEAGIPPSDLQHYFKLLNKLVSQRGSPMAKNLDQAGAYELLLLELLGGRLP